MPKPNQVVSDKVTATDTLALIDEVKIDPHGKVLEEYGVKILRYKFGYKMVVNHPDKANARLEFFIQNTATVAAVLTIQSGENENSQEVRAPGDLEGWNCKVNRKTATNPGDVIVTTGDGRDLNLTPTGNLLVKGEPLEAMIRRIVGEVIAS